MDYFAGIEAGGTKFKAIIAQDPASVIAEEIFQTTTPEETLPHVVAFVKDVSIKYNIRIVAAGLSCF